MVVFSLVNSDQREYTHPSSPEKQTHETDFNKILVCLTLGNVAMFGTLANLINLLGPLQNLCPI
jgi:hypothetical protein